MVRGKEEVGERGILETTAEGKGAFHTKSYSFYPGTIPGFEGVR